jgi:hypothetical protein
MVSVVQFYRLLNQQRYANIAHTIKYG